MSSSYPKNEKIVTEQQIKDIINFVMYTTLKPKVLVAMSGGVDSSVAAALLKKQGNIIAGGFMKNFSQEAWRGIIDKECPWEEDMRDAKKVCKILGIKFYSLNFEKEYEKKVINYFFHEYRAGRTPNPDIMCNKEIKFKIFLDRARELGFDYIATGHYVRKRGEGKDKRTCYKLLKGIDQKKDQSYFLYTLTQRQLKYCLFPIGDYTKPQVRALARKFKLPNAEKKDSQGICFIGHIRLHDFLKQRIKEKKGIIQDIEGRILGSHRGVWNYTLGQRQGLGIGGGTPYYVVDKNIKTNTITVAPTLKHPLLYKKNIFVKDIHWISSPPLLPLLCSAKIRYRQPDQKCVVRRVSRGFSITFSKPQFAPTPGQSVVLYKKDIMLGGGVIYFFSSLV